MNDRQAHRNVFSRAWSGVAPLWQAFWLIGVAGQALVLAAVDLLLGRVPRSILLRSAMIWPGTEWLACLCWAAFASVCIWRCAGNTRSPGWTALARIAVTLNAAFIAFGILLLLATGGS